MKLDPETLARIMGHIPPGEAELAVALSAAAEPAWKARRRRLDLRDQEIRLTVARHYGHLAVKPAAAALAAALERHTATRATRAAPPVAQGGDALVACLRRLLDLNQGQPICARTMQSACKTNRRLLHADNDLVPS